MRAGVCMSLEGSLCWFFGGHEQFVLGYRRKVYRRKASESNAEVAALACTIRERLSAASFDVMCFRVCSATRPLS